MLRIDVVPTLSSAADALVEWWTDPPGDPFLTDHLVSPGAGHARWLSQHLAARIGVAAGITHHTWTHLRRSAELELLGIDHHHDPWSASGLASALVEVFDQQWGQPWMARLRAHLEPTIDGATVERPGRRVATANRLAALLLSYGDRIPAMVRAWDEGHRIGPDGTSSGLGDQSWQVDLWRTLSDHVLHTRAGAPPPPLTRHELLLDALAEPVTGAVQRVAIVQLEPLRPHDLELAEAWACHRPLRLWQVAGANPAPGAPLARLALSHQEARRTVTRWQVPVSSPDPEPVSPSSTMVERLQARLRGEDVTPGPRDDTVQLHASHGPDRQVEVLREVLCALFEDQPDLEPRDVVVICPDLPRYAALLEAAFGLGELGHHPGHRLRVQTPGLRTVENQALAMLETVLALPSQRATSAELLDLCANPCIAHRFGFTGGERERLHALVERSEVRWGLDRVHREQGFDVSHAGSTWFAGVDRLLLGAALSDQPPASVGVTTAVERVDSQDLAAAGSLAELVSRLRYLRELTSGAAPARVWVDRIDEVLDLLASLPWEERWQIVAARAAVRGWAARSPGEGLLSRSDLRVVVADLATGWRRRPAFGNGNLQVVGLHELRAVPHRVVALLGLDDSCFPARPAVMGDDLVPQADQPAWADPRARSQAALLDALLAATERVLITFTHRDPRTNDAIDQPVIVTELVNALESVCSSDQGPSATRERWVRPHTLQPHSRENFVAEPGRPPFSFDHHSYAGAVQLQLRLDGPPTPPADPFGWRFLRPASDGVPISLVELVEFWTHPARTLLQHAVGTSLRRWHESVETELPLDLRGLREYAVGQQLLAWHDAGLTRDEAQALAWLQGTVPPGRLGSRGLDAVMGSVEELLHRSGGPHGESRDVRVRLDLGQTRLRGVVPVQGSTMVDRSYGALKGSALLRTWLHLLAASAASGDPELEALVARKDTIVRLKAPTAVEAHALLGWFVHWREVGLGRVLLAPPDLLHKEQEQARRVGGPDLPWLDQQWTWARDADWSVFCHELPWSQLRRRDSGVDDLSVAALATHVFGRIEEARR